MQDDHDKVAVGDRITHVMASGFALLRFPKDLEAAYHEDTAPARLKSLRASGWAIVLFTLLASGLDWIMVPDQVMLAVALRTLVLLPMNLLWLARLERIAPHARERGLMVLIWTAAAILVVLVLRSRSDVAPQYLIALSAYVLINGGLVRVRFWHAVIVDMGLLLLCLLAASQWPEAVKVLLVPTLIVLCAVMVFTLWGAYRVEHASRVYWLRSQHEHALQQRLWAGIAHFEALSTFDALTGLVNRRGAQRHMERVWSRARLSGQSVAILLMDVDHFKAYNDRYGHPAGDACLRQVARALSSCLRRPEDLVARWGGEEFIVVLTDVDGAQVRAMAAQLVDAVSALRVPHAGSRTAPWVTLSVGVACMRAFSPSSAGAASLAQAPSVATIARLADAALYEAKAQGRNRWVHADEAALAAPQQAVHGPSPVPDADEVRPSPVLHEEAMRALGRAWTWLMFPRELEARFWRDRAPSRYNGFLITGVLALLVFDLFLPVDYLLANDVWARAVHVRLAVFTPICAAVIALCWAARPVFLRYLPPWVHELVVMGSGLFAGLSLLYILIISHSPLIQYYHVGLMVTMLYGNLVQRLRFWFAVAFSVSVLAMHLYGAFTAEVFDPRLVMPIVTLIGFCGVFSLTANHAIERDERRNYLLGLRTQALLTDLRDVESRVRQLAKVDHLTGLFNRRHMDEVLQEVFSRPDKTAPGLAVIMIDVDHFKAYNDHYGHHGGDLCLRTIAQALGACVRGPTDVLGRYGGEEFIALVYPADADAAMQVAQRMQAAIAGAALPHAASPTAPVVTASMGIAWLAAHGATGMAELIKRADQALYEAKRLGRNRLVLGPC